MTRRLRYFPMIALAGFCSVLSPVLAAGQKLVATANGPADAAPEHVSVIPSDTDAPGVADHLIQAFRDRSSLTRVELLEQMDASTAIHPETVISLLRDALNDDDLLVREAALRALIRRDSTQNPVLSEADIAAFQGENAELAKVHMAAKNSDLAMLKDLMQNGDAVVQESAFEALSTNDLPGAVEALQAELRDRQSLYRLQTLELLARSGSTNSPAQLLPILREIAEDPDPLVKDYANQILKEKTVEARGNQTP